MVTAPDFCRSFVSMRILSLPLPTLGLLVGVACSLTDPAHEVRVPGSLIAFGDTARIELPSRAAVGTPVTIVVTSFADGCSRQGETEVSRGALDVDVAPFDYRTEGRDVTCPSILRQFRREAVVTFDTPGHALIRIRGMQLPGDQALVLTRQLFIE